MFVLKGYIGCHFKHGINVGPMTKVKDFKWMRKLAKQISESEESQTKRIAKPKPLSGSRPVGGVTGTKSGVLGDWRPERSV